MATTSSPTRVADRRARVREEVLDHAVDVMTEVGVGGLSMSEVARRVGVRGPSLYKHVPSLHALYDALFARGLTALGASLTTASDTAEPGVPQLRAGARSFVRWCLENPALAQLLFWRPVPGFEPSPEVFEASRADRERLRGLLRAAVDRQQLAPEALDDDAVRLWTVLLSGVVSQALANEPGASPEQSAFARLVDPAVDLFLSRYAPRRP